MIGTIAMDNEVIPWPRACLEALVCRQNYSSSMQVNAKALIRFRLSLSTVYIAAFQCPLRCTKPNHTCYLDINYFYYNNIYMSLNAHQWALRDKQRRGGCRPCSAERCRRCQARPSTQASVSTLCLRRQRLDARLGAWEGLVLSARSICPGLPHSTRRVQERVARAPSSECKKRFNNSDVVEVQMILYQQDFWRTCARCNRPVFHRYDYELGVENEITMMLWLIAWIALLRSSNASFIILLAPSS